MHLLTSFSLCFSSLGVFLLSSMSLRISASLIDFRSCCCWSETRWNLPLHPDVGIVHQGVRQYCGQYVLHLSLLLSDMFLPRLFFLRSGAGVVSAVAFLPARRSRRCGHCRRKCKVWRSNRPDDCAQSELKHSVVLSSCFCSSCFFLRFLDFCFIKCATCFCCCCRCRRACFIIVFSCFARVAAEMKHDRTCLFNRM